MLDIVNLKDNEFDLAIVDPPYGIGDFLSDNTRQKPVVWNDSIPDNKYFSELYRISKKQIIWGANFYNCFNGGALVWFKGEQSKTVSACEIASLSFQNKVDYIHINWQSGFYREMIENIIHACQKPIALYRWLLQNYTKPNDTILDTHVGSGSSIIACLEEGFDITGYEIDKDYYDSAIKRIDIYESQIKIPFGG